VSNIDTNDVLRYLGCSEGLDDARVLAHIAQLHEELNTVITPKHIYRLWDCEVQAQAVGFGGLRVHSGDLARHLRGCTRVAVFAATLGAEADALLRRYNATEMDKAVIADAVCTAMIEAACDSVVGEITREPELLGWQLTERFSAGYGDFDITHQRDVLTMLDCPRRIGLTLTDGNMLCPAKSVTAVVGLRRIV